MFDYLDDNEEPKTIKEWGAIIGFDADTCIELVKHFHEVMLNGDNDSLDTWADIGPADAETNRQQVMQICYMVQNEIPITKTMLDVVERIALTAYVGSQVVSALDNDTASTVDEAMAVLVAEKTMNIAMRMKLQMCEDEKGPADLPAFLFYLYNGGSEFDIIPVSVHEDIEENDIDVYAVVSNTLKEARQEYGPPAAVVFVSDIYIREHTSHEDAMNSVNMRSGTLKNDYATNPNSDVYEALCCVLCSEDNSDPIMVLTGGYKYDDFGMPFFDKNSAYIDVIERSEIGASSFGDRARIITSINDFMKGQDS